MIRTMIPEQFIELDTDTQIYQKLISVYGEEFDTIKAYIDNLAFMHTVNYDRLESVPDKFMYKLSKLLAFDFHDSFSNADIFEYLLTEDEDGKTLQDYNLELWRKMLKNIDVVRLEAANQIEPEYRKALKSKRSTLLVEISDLYTK